MILHYIDGGILNITEVSHIEITEKNVIYFYVTNAFNHNIIYGYELLDQHIEAMNITNKPGDIEAINLTKCKQVYKHVIKPNKEEE